MPELTRSEAHRVLAGLEDKRQQAIDDGDLDEIQAIDRRIDAVEAAMHGEVVRYADGRSQLPSTTEGKSNVAAGVLALLLGGFGVHKFYLGKTGQGILYLVFFWTLIPALIGFIEGLVYLFSDSADFARRNP